MIRVEVIGLPEVAEKHLLPSLEEPRPSGFEPEGRPRCELTSIDPQLLTLLVRR